MLRSVLVVVVALAALVVAGSAGSTGSGQPSWQIRDLGSLGGKQAGALALNDHGQVVGWSELGRVRHAVLWQNGRIRDLGSFGQRDSIAVAINQQGQIACIAGRSAAPIGASGLALSPPSSGITASCARSAPCRPR